MAGGKALGIDVQKVRVAVFAFSRLFYFRTWQESLIAHCPREWAPGTKHRYGVVGIILAIRALELMIGKNYWHAMGCELFAPLGIKNTLPGGTGFSAENLARLVFNVRSQKRKSLGLFQAVSSLMILSKGTLRNPYGSGNGTSSVQCNAMIIRSA